MIPDGGSLHEITIEEKGIINLRLETNGQSAHAARPWLGLNPLSRLLQALARLEQVFAPPANHPDRWYPTCAITNVGTDNTSFNLIPAHAYAQLDIRFPPPQTSA